MARTTTKMETIDSLGNVASSNLLAGYQAANKDENVGGTSYYGFIDSAGNWYIERVTGTDIDFAAGATNYAANWTGRAGLSYAKFDATF